MTRENHFGRRAGMEVCAHTCAVANRAYQVETVVNRAYRMELEACAHTCAVANRAYQVETVANRAYRMEPVE